MHSIIPGILETDFQEIEKKLSIIKQFSRYVHIDIIDGKFAPTKTLLDPKPFEKYKDEFFMEAHLMVENPTDYIKPFASSGFKRFLGHVEKMPDPEEFIAQGQIFGEVGLALDVDTDLKEIKVNLDDLDCILLMSVKAGKSGQEFVPQTLVKITELRKKTQIDIEIDGGINDTTLLGSKRNGANRFVVTSFIFESIDPMQSYEKLTTLT